MRYTLLAAVALAACKAKGTESGAMRGDPIHTDSTGAAVAPTAGSPDAAIQAVFGVLGRIDLAIREHDPTRLAGMIAPDYVAVACGVAGGFASPNAAAIARAARARPPAAWRVSLAADGTLAWATDAGPDTAANDATDLEVLALRDHRWVLVASGATGKTRADNACDAPAPTVRALPAGRDLPLATIPVGAAPTVAMCGVTGTDKVAMAATTTHEGGVTRTEKLRAGRPLELATAFAVDLDGDRVPDLRQADASTGHYSERDTMAWIVGGSARFHTLVVAQQGVTGWSIAAALWTPVALRDCPNAGPGRVTITDTEMQIMDVVAFPAGEATLSDAARQVLDAIAATLQGNPSIRQVALRAYATADEPQPLLLAERRGLAARKYIVDTGRVTVDRIVIEFYDHGYVPVPDKPPALAAQRTIAFEILKRDD